MGAGIMTASAELMTFRPQVGPQEVFLGTAADIAIYGGAAGGGKTYSLLLEPLRHVRNPRFTALFFRQTSTQIRAPGGLWDESATIYPHLGAVPREVQLEWVFPGGATVKFGYMQYESDKYNYQGAQITLLCFDELTHFSETQFFYMLSRNRSVSGIRPYVRAATNPDADSWVARFIAWWIDQDTGYPIPERAGVLRYFARVNEQLLWGDTPVAVREHAAEAGVLAAEIEPKSVTFIPARLTDNPALTRKDPGYLANLMAQTLVERERLLGGNWKIRATEGSIFRRAWFAQAMVDDVPRAARRVRYWDKAGTPGGGKFTCGVLMATLGGLYYVEDVIREQVGATAREALILETSRMDARQYGQVDVWIEQEPGSGGKESAENTIRNLAGFTIRAERVTGEKLVRARPFSAQVEPGNVKLKRGPWNTAYIEELVQCPDGLYWDQIDASSGAFNKLAIGGTEFRAATGGERPLATGYTPR
jgi:predicted phage terminase large subunit-like protein